MAQLYELRRNHFEQMRAAAADLHAEAMAAIPVVVKHFGLDAESEKMLRWEVSVMVSAKRCVVAIARSLVPRGEHPRKRLGDG